MSLQKIGTRRWLLHKFDSRETELSLATDISAEPLSLRRSSGLDMAGVRREGGFSLVEIMVGMVMGLLAMVIILQMFSLFEGQKRTTTGGDDAQNSAAIALHGLRADLQQAGYGVSEYSLVNCNFTISGVTFPLAPVTINPATSVVPAGDANTDTLLVVYGDANGITEGNVITAQSSASSYTVQMPGVFSFQDNVIAAPVNCSATTNLFMDRVTATPPVGATAVSVTTGVAFAKFPATLYNLGQAPVVRAYAIRGGNLTVCDFTQNNCSSLALTGNQSVWVPIAAGIVNMRAQYGRDTATAAMTQAQIDNIVNTSPPTPRPGYVVNIYDQTTPNTSCLWARAPAVRLVLVARGPYDRDAVTSVAPVWSGSAISVENPQSLPIDLTADPDWQHYRYKVMETVVPIRNMTWLGVQPLC